MIGYAVKVIIVLTLLFAVMDPLHSEAGLLEWFFGDIFAHDKKAFEHSILENTLDSYESFLKKYPDSKYSKYANKMLSNFKRQIVIQPIKVDADSPFFSDNFNYQVFFDKEPIIYPYSIFIYKNNAPFFSEVPPQVSLQGFRLMEENVAILIQDTSTSFAGQHKLSNSSLGGNLQRYFVIDNSTQHNLNVFIDVYISNISSNISVPAKSHFVITLNLANLTTDIMYIRVNRKDNNKVLEEFYFPIIHGSGRSMRWYVYNIDKKNKYRVKTAIYRKE